MDTPKDEADRAARHIARSLDALDAVARQTIRELTSGNLPWPLTMVGAAGSGKSCAALVVSDYVCGAIYRTCHDLCFDINDAKFDRLATAAGYRITEREYWKTWERAPLCIIDELGTRGTISDAMYDTVKYAIDAREGRPLIVVSNLSMGEINRAFDDRITSRLSAGTILKFDGDRRCGGAATVRVVAKAEKGESNG